MPLFSKFKKPLGIFLLSISLIGSLAVATPVQQLNKNVLADTSLDTSGLMGSTMDSIENFGTNIEGALGLVSQDGYLTKKKQYSFSEFTTFFMGEGVAGADGKAGRTHNPTSQLLAKRMRLLSINGLLTSKSSDATNIVGMLVGVAMSLFKIVPVTLMAVGLMLSYLGSVLLSLVATLLKSLNIFQYLGNSVMKTNLGEHPTTLAGKVAAGLKPIIELVNSFSGIAMVVGISVFALTVVSLIFNAKRNAGQHGTKIGQMFFRVMGVMFTWTLLPLIIAYMISGTANLIGNSNADKPIGPQVIAGSIYNTESFFTQAGYVVGPNTDPDETSGTTSNDDGNNSTGLMDSQINSDYVINSNAPANFNSDQVAKYEPTISDAFGILFNWDLGSSFNADDVGSALDLDDLTEMANGKKYDDDENQTAFKSLQSANPVLADKIKENGGVVGEDISDFDKTANYSKRGEVLSRAYMMRNLAFTEVTNTSKGPNLTKALKKTATPSYSWNQYRLVGGTPQGRLGRGLDMISVMILSGLFNIFVFAAMVVTIGQLIGKILAAFVAAGVTGTWPMITKVFLLTMAMIADVVVLLVIATTFTSLYAGLGSVFSSVLGVSGIARSSVNGLGWALLIKGLTSAIVGVITFVLLWKLRKAFVEFFGQLTGRIAEMFDRLSGIQAGSDGSASTAIKGATAQATDAMGRTSALGDFFTGNKEAGKKGLLANGMQKGLGTAMSTGMGVKALDKLDQTAKDNTGVGGIAGLKGSLAQGGLALAGRAAGMQPENVAETIGAQHEGDVQSAGSLLTEAKNNKGSLDKTMKLENGDTYAQKLQRADTAKNKLNTLDQQSADVRADSSLSADERQSKLADLESKKAAAREDIPSSANMKALQQLAKAEVQGPVALKEAKTELNNKANAEIKDAKQKVRQEVQEAHQYRNAAQRQASVERANTQLVQQKLDSSSIPQDQKKSVALVQQKLEKSVVRAGGVVQQRVDQVQGAQLNNQTENKRVIVDEQRGAQVGKQTTRATRYIQDKYIRGNAPTVGNTTTTNTVKNVVDNGKVVNDTTSTNTVRNVTDTAKVVSDSKTTNTIEQTQNRPAKKSAQSRGASKNPKMMR